ncbi:MAG: LCP family protein [Lachnospiraceae bacterium]|nr:LCP family protein [Lachnospiraceae bacterium]
MEEDFNVDMSKLPDETSVLEKSLAGQVGEFLDEKQQKEEYRKKNWFQKIPLWIRITVITLLSLILVLVIGLSIWLRHTLVKFDDTKGEETFEEDENSEGLTEIDPDEVKWDENLLGVKKEKGVVNVLLVGEEAIGSGGGRGRTDSIMVATANFDTGDVKLTSFMRDMYVQIPGYQDNKLNSAYTLGGIPLIKETLELNFGIKLDGAVLVNFDGFQAVVDALGGVEIDVSADEAAYLNRTNYISNPAYRTLKEGKQILNGNQALGYMRIRHVSTADHTSDDFGRTQRQRTLINAIFDKYKDASVTELVALANSLVQYIQTDIPIADLIGYVSSMGSLHPGKLQTMRIPCDGMYDAVFVRKMAVLVPHLQENQKELHDFIFGPEETENKDNTEGSTDGNTLPNEEVSLDGDQVVEGNS